MIAFFGAVLVLGIGILQIVDYFRGQRLLQVKEQLMEAFGREEIYGMSAEALTMPDIYTTYYCMSIRRETEEKDNREDAAKYLKYFESEKEFYFRDGKGDLLINIYYFCEIMKEFRVTSQITDFLARQLDKLQTANGLFGVEVSDVERTSDNQQKYLLPTKMACEAYEVLEKEVPNVSLIERQIEEGFKSRDEISDLIMLTEIAESINFEVESNAERIQRIVDDYCEKMGAYDPDSLDLISMYDFLTVAGDRLDKVSEYTKEDYVKSIKKRKDLQGFYNLQIGHKDENILPTYYAVLLLRSLGDEISDVDGLLQWVGMFAVEDRGYIMSGTLPRDLETNYYVLRILEHYGESEEQIKNLAEKILKQNQIDIENEKYENIYYYLGVKDRTGQDGEIQEALCERLKRDINQWESGSSGLNFYQMYFQVRICMEKYPELLTDKKIGWLEKQCSNMEDINAYTMYQAAILKILDLHLPKPLTETLEYIYSHQEEIFNMQYELDNTCILYWLLENEDRVSDSMQKILEEIVTDSKKREYLYRSGRRENDGELSAKSTFYALCIKNSQIVC